MAEIRWTLQAADDVEVIVEFNKVALREIILGNYRIVYRFKKDVVEILAIYHGARLFDPADLE
ncbi:MAG: type II toxin-antitoxin system RelE/ParE family toxin [Verrucomicrobia bacterium]|nr:MAG: type II toxin-antitoxin system RelE/ParE family toxin [Verrucomicrobiota bacterium]